MPSQTIYLSGVRLLNEISSVMKCINSLNPGAVVSLTAQCMWSSGSTSRRSLVNSRIRLELTNIEFLLQYDFIYFVDVIAEVEDTAK